jgi:hypothetical protein
VPLTCHYSFWLTSVTTGSVALDHIVDGVGNEAAGLRSSVLVHHGGTHAVMAHAVHQVPQARAARSSQRVAGMAKIMKMQPGAPMAATAADQLTSRRKLPRSVPPRVPVNNDASGG